MQQMLWIETILKVTAGTALFLLPGLVAKGFGLPVVQNAFWPRIAGGLLLAIGAGVYLQGAAPKVGGIGLGGLVAINLAGAAALLSLIMLKRGADTARGTITLVAMLVTLVALALIEIAMLKIG